MPAAVIVSAVRTPIGAFLGSLSELPAPRLGAHVIAESLRRARIEPAIVDEVIMGNVLTAGVGQAPARQAAIFAGLPEHVPCMTINKVCGSGLKAVMLAEQAIRCGDAEIVVAGGQESMSNAPYLLPRVRTGLRMGHAQLVDSMIHDGLWDVYNQFHMGDAAELCAKTCSIGRDEQDEYAILSYRRALEAQAKGYFADEIVPVTYERPNGQTVTVDTDEEPAKVRFEKIPHLKPVFRPDGTVTAANASSIDDGAAAVVVMSEERAAALGIKPLARIVAHGSVAQKPEWFTTAPIEGIRHVLRKAGMQLEDIDLFEINEAFAVVALVAQKQLGIPLERLNVHGGAVALGHPIGASGARILVTLIHALRRYGKRYGMAAICIGGGEASALIVENLQ
ncbi:MAG: acetyl-CoA C-acetyltransferase [Candidatus Kapabacteria bacterium]|nr:acetyl-CoA C-acetyltransferase [Candidatus Kapabacteria bacterium]MDW8011717.1 acetyl-CoA C-acetyltransferase [Bacteroidota bacterium]